MIEPFTIKDVEKFVEDNSKCKLVSGSYKNADSIITLKCPCEKEFSLKFRNFKYGNTRICKECTNEKNGIVNSLKSAKSLVKKLSHGSCVVTSVDYVDNKKPLQIRCGCGRYFQCSITNVKQKKVLQCNHCAHNVFRMTDEELRELANNSGCEIANAENYINENSRLDFICGCGNVFTTSLASFKENKKRCDACYKSEASSSQRRNFELVKLEVDKTDCKLISKSSDYINQYSKLVFECPCGNQFERSYTNFSQRDKLCLNCTASTGEKKVIEALELMGVNYKREFSFPDLVSRKGFPLRFDFAVTDDDNEISYLIEYDGEFHYEPIISEQMFSSQKYNDNLKDMYCKDKQIPLLRIPYFEFENIEKIIKEFSTIGQYRGKAQFNICGSP